MKNVIYITSSDSETRKDHISNIAKACTNFCVTGGGWESPSDAGFWKLMDYLETVSEPDFDNIPRWLILREAQDFSFDFIVFFNLLIEAVSNTENIRLFISCPASDVVDGRLRLLK